VLSIILPYAAYNTGLENNGANWLQWADAVFAIATLVGAFATYAAEDGWFGLSETTFLMTAFFMPIGMAASGYGNFTSSNAQIFL